MDLRGGAPIFTSLIVVNAPQLWSHTALIQMQTLASSVTLRKSLCVYVSSSVKQRISTMPALQLALRIKCGVRGKVLGRASSSACAIFEGVL